MVNLRNIGSMGEDLAMQFLEKKWYELYAKNVTFPGGEIDLVLIKKQEFHFVEVKFRTGKSHGSALESFTVHKRKMFYRAIQKFCDKNSVDIDTIWAHFIGIQKTSSGYEYDFFENVELF